MKYLKFNFLFLSFIFFSLAANAAISNQDMANVINKAGKQRMLTQKMTKEVMFITLNIDVEINQEELEATIELFDKTLNGLINGDSYLGLVKTENADISAKLKEVENLWKPFQEKVTAVLKGDMSPDVLAAINQQNVPLLKKMNEAVQAYEKEGGSLFEPKLANVINKAGKQRMLIQKMTKELLLVAKGIEAEANKTNLTSSVAEFEKVLTELSANSINESIASQLKKVQKKWAKYKPILDTVDISETALKKVDKLSLSLYRAMNKAVQLYANSVTN
ncbi:type IV pili methyl-accepting chemotaxis transducer N-terminal domain-containing protein [Candidatus Halobeggiatoa sp. HSG11]|nr:type IV pili methyl-accepting chemotaxis transducer N-terminal domain-containing protein [Candidatus Halobeggiatoa sp. HSG11]